MAFGALLRIVTRHLGSDAASSSFDFSDSYEAGAIKSLFDSLRPVPCLR
jgi:hypothetical protein